MDLVLVLILLVHCLGRLLLQSIHFFIDPCILVHKPLLGCGVVVASDFFTPISVNDKIFLEGILPFYW